MKEVLIALAHRIKLNEADWQKIFIKSTVETAFMLKEDHSFVDASQIGKFLNKERITQVLILDGEITTVLDGLIDEKKVSFSLSSKTYLMDGKEIKKLEETTNEWFKIEEEVKNEWLSYLHSNYQEITKQDLEKIWQCLIDKFVGKVLLRYGAESAQIVFAFADTTKSNVPINQILEEAVRGLPEITCKVAKKEFPLFFTPVSANRKKYLIGLLNCAFDQFSVAFSKETLEEIYNKSTYELLLFLDTNFIFSLFGLHEHHLNESVQELFSMLNKISNYSGGKLKAKIYFLEDTKEEFIRTLDANILDFKNVIPSKSIARAVIQSSDISGVLLAYMKKIEESNLPISIEEFLSPFKKGVEHILKEKGIEIYRNNSLNNLYKQQDVIDDILTQQEHFKTLEKQRGREKKWEAIQHDVRMWHCIKELRKGIPDNASFLHKKAYILTCDYGLVAFDRWKQGGRLHNMFCLLPPQLLQILSFFVPRTDNFENAFLYALRMPIAKHIDKETERVTLNIIKTLSIYKDFSEEVAIDILKDEALINEVKEIKDPVELKKAIDERVSKELAETRKLLIEKSKEFEKENARNLEKLRHLKEEKDRALSTKDSESEKIKNEIKRIDLEKQSLEKKVNELSKFKSDTNADRERRKLMISKIKKLIIAFFILSLIFVCASYYLPKIRNQLFLISISILFMTVLIIFRNAIKKWWFIIADGAIIISLVKNSLDIVNHFKNK